MNKICFLCLNCFKTKEPPEEIKSNKECKVPEMSTTSIKDKPSIDEKDQTQLLNESQNLNPSGTYVRRKYMRVRSKTSQSNHLDISLSDNDVSSRSQENNNNPNH
ncbi:hypothetical protein SteCoe_12837 [Stentor coeruleus]|uniref:Uncharacterized protein n=1 Tax=Stentor coeruleus TaxID=5963 RepID=A0A1R2C9V4_9CILI|nr:hypothetical protein SteCoe_12837 [Stentor coeruleus]